MNLPFKSCISIMGFLRAYTLVSGTRWLESAIAVPTNQGWRLKMMQSTWAENKAFPE